MCQSMGVTAASITAWAQCWFLVLIFVVILTIVVLLPLALAVVWKLSQFGY